MEIKNMQMSDIEQRKEEIRAMVPEATEAQIAELNEELDALETRAAEIKEAVEKREKIVDRLKKGEGEKTMEFEKKEITKTESEVRNSPEYIRAFENYVRTGDDKECRTLYSEIDYTGEGAMGSVAVPDFVLEIVKTAWEDSKIMSLVRRFDLPGNLEVNFELAAGEATIHYEGAAAVDEEDLELGIVRLIPYFSKKWIGISRTVYNLRGESFLRYIYDELSHKIVEKIENELIRQIASLPDTATATTPAAAQVAAAPAMGTIAAALAELSPEAKNPVVVLNRATWGAFKAAAYQANFAADPFEGLTPIFTSELPAYADASADDVYAIVGDFTAGAIINFPAGDGIHFIFDEVTRKKDNIIEVLGEQYAGFGPVAMNAFVNIVVPDEG